MGRVIWRRRACANPVTSHAFEEGVSVCGDPERHSMTAGMADTPLLSDGRPSGKVCIRCSEAIALRPGTRFANALTDVRIHALDRAMLLRSEGKITFRWWAETVREWAAGHDVARKDFGPVEPLPARIRAVFADRNVTTGEIAAWFGVDVSAASRALKRLAACGAARQHMGIGEWAIGGSGGGGDGRGDEGNGEGGHA